ncbi:DUF177 domain-containing protein [Lysobacter pythonis]|uniref:Large ribosomal RNA subunit accumulation protein YceD n=1 Tax=Solilutibacter pythonis TaxID=2483112 RepID=A0A3M2HT55_9GAMM|nr:YceD family protein [Lysobacter pythonis]RMH90850.1 DUF177 domain-containing protein [Lysobacter pythonis]
MSADSSTAVDAWRMVSARRVLEGELPLAALPRLREALNEHEGVVRYRIEFGRDTLDVAFVALRIEAGLPLQCQRSLETFVQPVTIEQTLGLIRAEDEEAALPPGYEPLLLPADARIVPAELVEDELILAVPVVPVAPGSQALARDWPAMAEESAAANPFAALSALKKQKN